jgi:hypothetical protein
MLPQRRRSAACRRLSEVGFREEEMAIERIAAPPLG